MPKINQEEYEVLKELDEKWKWIARDEDSKKSTFPNELWLYEYKPQKSRIHWLGEGGATKRFGYDNLFQFIKHKNQEPHNIAELIEEYEDSKEYKDSLVIEYFLDKAKESEETEVKSKQELIEEWESAIEAAEFYGKGKEDRLIEYMRDFVDDLNQLDEPEVLSQEWIDEHTYHEDEYDFYYADPDELKNLLVPKQEEVDHAYRKGFKEGERQTAEYFESITEEPSKEQVWKYLSEHGIEVVDEEPETVASVIADFYKSLERFIEVLGTKVEGLEE